jgi:ribA/ribD-fused uncharacterized protein
MKIPFGFKLRINNIIVGDIELTDSEGPALGGKFYPNEDFIHFKKIYDDYYSDIQNLSSEAETNLNKLDFVLIDKDWLCQNIFVMYIDCEDNTCNWLDAEGTKNVEFYRINEYPYGVFSNFSKHPIDLDGKIWPTSEHYFQAKKFEGYHYEEEIRLAKSAALSAKMGNSREYPLRDDWNEVKEDIMYEAIYAKFTQHKDLLALLLQTKDAILIEHTTNDSYWADGGDGKGKNRLGVLLMRLREELLKASSE